MHSLLVFGTRLFGTWEILCPKLVASLSALFLRPLAGLEVFFETILGGLSECALLLASLQASLLPGLKFLLDSHSWKVGFPYKIQFGVI